MRSRLPCPFAGFLVVELAAGYPRARLSPSPAARRRVALVQAFHRDGAVLAEWAALVRRWAFFAVDASPSSPALSGTLTSIGDERLIVTCSALAPGAAEHPVGAYRRIAEVLRSAGSRAPVWIRNTTGTSVKGDNSFLSRLIEASIL